MSIIDRSYEQLQKEIAELDTPHARYQAQLDRWVADQRAAEQEARALLRQLNPTGLIIWD